MLLLNKKKKTGFFNTDFKTSIAASISFPLEKLVQYNLPNFCLKCQAKNYPKQYNPAVITKCQNQLMVFEKYLTETLSITKKKKNGNKLD